MRTEQIVTKKLKIVRKFCDICHNEIPWRMLSIATKCVICHKDLCVDCVGYEDLTSQDYSTIYCGPCWKIGAPYRDIIGRCAVEAQSAQEAWEKEANR